MNFKIVFSRSFTKRNFETSKIKKKMALETVYAIHSFEAEHDDEIPFQVGEPIIILEKDELYGDSWWKVRK